MPEQFPELPLFAEPARELETRAAVGEVLADTELRAVAGLHDFSLVYTECDADAPGTLDEALRLGWREISSTVDRVGGSWGAAQTVALHDRVSSRQIPTLSAWPNWSWRRPAAHSALAESPLEHPTQRVDRHQGF